MDSWDYKDLRKIYPKTAFIAILQSTKSNDYRGGKDLEHEFEIATKIDNGVAKTFKNRYGAYGAVEIYSNKIILDKDEK
jgi:predicted ATP-dependent serine protease